MYFIGWNPGLEELLNGVLPILSSVTDPRMRCHFLWMEAFHRSYQSDYPAACRVSQECRQYARRAGSFHQYFLATHNFVMGLIHRGDLGEAIRIAREDTELAATNHHLLEQIWLESLQAMVAIEVFDFEGAHPICERIARNPMIMSYHITPHILLWLGLARFGMGNIDGASEAFDRMATAVERGGVGFEYRYPLLQAQASCALLRGDIGTARGLTVRSIELAEQHRAAGAAARGYRLLSEIASQEGDHAAAVEHISAAMAALQGFEILNVEWQVYATAAKALAVVGRHRKSEEARAHGIQVAERVSATLAGEPALRQSLLAGIRRQLGNPLE
jgi:hypothetical protein